MAYNNKNSHSMSYKYYNIYRFTCITARNASRKPPIIMNFIFVKQQWHSIYYNILNIIHVYYTRKGTCFADLLG